MLSIKNKFALALTLFLPLTYFMGIAIVNLISFLIALIGIIFLVDDVKIKKFQNNHFFLGFFIFCFFLFLSSIDSNHLSTSITKSFGFSLYFLLLYAFIHLINLYKKVFFLYLFNILLIVILFLFLFTLYELFFLKSDIFKNQFTSIFDDKVLGIFIVKIFFLTIGLLYHLKNNFNKFIFNIFFSLIFFSSFFMVILSQHRTSFILLNLGIFILFLSDKSHIKLYFYNFLFILFLLILTNIFMNNIIFEKYFINIFNSFINNNRIFIFSDHYTGHYISSLKMFISNPLTGIGTNLFRYECSNDEYIYIYKTIIDWEGLKIPQNSCSTHSHNFYIQILAENGIFNFIILTSLFCSVCLKLFKIIRLNIVDKNYLYFTCLLSVFLILFPFAPTLNFFNSWANTLNFLIISFLLSNLKDQSH